jgi:hypothetical protein
MTLRPVLSGRSADSQSISSVHESSGVQVDVTLGRPSTTDGQKDVDRCSDEQATSRQERHHHTEATLDAAAERWTDTTASTSTDHQPHDSTADE